MKFLIAVASLMITAVVAPSAAYSQEFTWKYWGDKQGAYEMAGKRIRFINIEYDGPSSPTLWQKAFAEAAALYKRENITYHAGNDGDYFLVSGLSNSRKRIIGWADDRSGSGGYVVIKEIVNSQVIYELNSGKAWSLGDNPINFEKWVIGTGLNDWTTETIHAAVQIWKHKGSGSYDAGVSLRFVSTWAGENPYR